MSEDGGSVADQTSLDAKTSSETKTDQDVQNTIKEISQTKDNGKASMHVKVYSPFLDYYDGQIFSLSAENLTGPFDILPMHHNFITLLSPCELTLRTVKEQEEPVHIRISGGVLHVKSDEVLVFLDV